MSGRAHRRAPRLVRSFGLALAIVIAGSMYLTGPSGASLASPPSEDSAQPEAERSECVALNFGDMSSSQEVPTSPDCDESSLWVPQITLMRAVAGASGPQSEVKKDVGATHFRMEWTVPYLPNASAYQQRIRSKTLGLNVVKPYPTVPQGSETFVGSLSTGCHQVRISIERIVDGAKLGKADGQVCLRSRAVREGRLAQDGVHGWAHYQWKLPEHVSLTTSAFHNLVGVHGSIKLSFLSTISLQLDTNLDPGQVVTASILELTSGKTVAQELWWLPQSETVIVDEGDSETDIDLTMATSLPGIDGWKHGGWVAYPAVSPGGQQMLGFPAECTRVWDPHAVLLRPDLYPLPPGEELPPPVPDEITLPLRLVGNNVQQPGSMCVQIVTLRSPLTFNAQNDLMLPVSTKILVIRDDD